MQIAGERVEMVIFYQPGLKSCFQILNIVYRPTRHSLLNQHGVSHLISFATDLFLPEANYLTGESKTKMWVSTSLETLGI